VRGGGVAGHHEVAAGLLEEPLQLPGHGPARQPHGGRDLLVFLLVHQDGHGDGLGHGVEAGQQPLHEEAVQPVAGLGGGLRRVLQRRLGVLARVPAEVEAVVGGDPVEPGDQVLAGEQGGVGADEPEEDLLGGVPGGLGVPEEAEAAPVHHRAVEPVELGGPARGEQQGGRRRHHREVGARGSPGLGGGVARRGAR